MSPTGSDNQDDRTIISGNDPEFISELADYLDTLSSPVRLHILSFLGSRPRTIRQVSHEIGTSYENTKKHLTRLLTLGIIRKEIGVSQDLINHGQPVFYYSLEPGSLDRLIKSMGVFTSITSGSDPALHHQVMHATRSLSDVFPLTFPSLTLKAGPDAGRVFPLTGEMYRIGREESGWDSLVPEPAVLIQEAYRSVSRVSGPHAWVFRKGDSWLLRDGESKGGTFLNGRRISREEPEVLSDGVIIELAQGPLAACLIFTRIPPADFDIRENSPELV